MKRQWYEVYEESRGIRLGIYVLIVAIFLAVAFLTGCSRTRAFVADRPELLQEGVGVAETGFNHAQNGVSRAADATATGVDAAKEVGKEAGRDAASFGRSFGRGFKKIFVDPFRGSREKNGEDD